MVFAVNSYGGYQHSGENKLLSPHEALERAHSLEDEGVFIGAVPLDGRTQIGPISDVNKDGSRNGFVAELTQGGVLFDPSTGKAEVVAFTLDIAIEDERTDELVFSGSDVLRASEQIILGPNNGSSADEAEDGEEIPENVASVAGIAMPATQKLLMVQMIPELPQGTA